jgi:hypothetical protein
MYIEKAKDAKEIEQRVALLSKSVTALSYFVANPNTKERGLLWFELAQLAWKYNIKVFFSYFENLTFFRIWINALLRNFWIMSG